MERKLISSYDYLARITIPALFFMVNFEIVVFVHKLDWVLALFWIIINLSLGIFGYYLFRLKHPVYFDENAVYYGKKGGEHTIPFANIKNISVSVRWISKWVTIRYANSDNEAKAIRFYAESASRATPDNAVKGMKEFENLARNKKLEIEFTYPLN